MREAPPGWREEVEALLLETVHTVCDDEGVEGCCSECEAAGYLLALLAIDDEEDGQHVSLAPQSQSVH